MALGGAVKQRDSQKKWKRGESVAEGAGRELWDQAGESTDKRN